MANIGQVAVEQSVTPPALAQLLGTAPQAPRHSREVQIAPHAFVQCWWVRWAMLTADALALEAALLGGLIARYLLSGLFPINLQVKLHYLPLALGMLVLPVGFWFVGLYPGYGMGAVERFRKRICTLLILFAMLIAGDLMLQSNGWSRGTLLMTLMLALVLCPLAETLLRSLLIRHGRWGTPVVIFGANAASARLIHNLREHGELGLAPIAILDNDHQWWGKHIQGVPVVGGVSLARRIANQAQVAIVAEPGLRASRIGRLAERLPFHRIILASNLTGLASLWVSSRDLGGMLGLELQKNLLRRRNWFIKRMIDYLFGSILLLATLPLLAVLMLWIKRVDRGPALYWQERIGMGGKPFRVWKLRTMYQDAEQRLEAHLASSPQLRQEWNRYFKLRNDPRVLAGIGKLLRKTSLDELPQLWNVLRGDMSLVGPRPLPRYHLDQFTPTFRSLRRRVLPGLTGLWQVSGRADGDLLASQSLDTYYIRNWSLWLDAYLLVRTCWAVIHSRGAY